MKYMLMIILFTNCCHKMDCLVPNPRMTFYFNVKKQLGQSVFYVKIIDTSSNIVTDSVTILDLYVPKGDSLFPILSLDLKSNLDYKRNKFVLINKTFNINDTIENVNYETQTYRDKCNSCLIGSDIQTFERYINYTFKYNNVKLSGNEYVIN